MSAVQRALQDNGESPERLVLEVTERATLTLDGDAPRVMRVLAALGVGIAIDDFGSTYASLSCVILPGVHYLKIDRSFVTGLPEDARDTAIAGGVLNMGQWPSTTVLAEGIESDAQSQCLKDAGCTTAQGFLYAHPLLPREFEPMVWAQRLAEVQSAHGTKSA